MWQKTIKHALFMFYVSYSDKTWVFDQSEHAQRELKIEATL